MKTGWVIHLVNRQKRHHRSVVHCQSASHVDEYKSVISLTVFCVCDRVVVVVVLLLFSHRVADQRQSKQNAASTGSQR